MHPSTQCEDDENKINILENRPEQKRVKIWNKPLTRQMFLVLGPISLMLCAGIGIGTTTVMIPQVKASNSSIKLTPDLESWLYSVYGFGSTPAVLTMPYLSEAKGYKFMFIVTCSAMITSFILQYVASSAVHLIISFLLLGFTMGGNATIGLTMISEFADPKYRGSFLVFKSATYFWGMWLSNAIGTFFSWRNIPLVGIWPAIYAFVTCFMWPQSPYWLAKQNRMEECKTAFRWLRGEGQDAEKELTFLTNVKPTVQYIPKNMFVSLKRTLVLRQFYMPFFLNIAVFFIYSSCGKMVCQSYVLVIIKEITKNEGAAYTGMLIMDGVTIVGMYIGSYIAAKVNRRTMFISTTACTIFFLYLFSAYLYLIHFNIIIQNNKVSLILLILYSFSVSWGPMLLCTSIFCEITPLRFKVFITSISFFFLFIMQSTFIKLAPFIFRHASINGTFAVYGTCTVLPLLFVNKFLPETRNKTFNEIESSFCKKKCNGVNSNVEGQEMLKYPR